MEDTSLDLTGIGKLAKAIPKNTWDRMVGTACETFEKCLAPITETTGGIGRLIAAKFDHLVDAEKILTAETFQKATEKVEKSGMLPKGNYKPNIILKVVDESSKQTDTTIRELWANLLAQEILDGAIHPEVTNILSRLSAPDAQLLAEVAEQTPKEVFVLESSDPSITLLPAGYGSGKIFLRPRFTFSEALLENLNLIERKEAKWTLTSIGVGFIESVTEPTKAKTS